MQSTVRRLLGDSTRRRHREIQINSPPSSGRSAVPRKASEFFLRILKPFTKSLYHVGGSLQLFEGSNSLNS